MSAKRQRDDLEDEQPRARRSKEELRPAVEALKAAGDRLSSLILEASGTLPFLLENDTAVAPLSRRLRPVSVSALVAYAQKISYSTAGPPLTPGGMVTFMPHPHAMRLSSLYSGVPGLSKTTTAAAPEVAPEAQHAPAVPVRPAAAPRPPPAASLLNLDLDDGGSSVSSDDDDSSSSSSSSSASPGAEPVDDGW